MKSADTAPSAQERKDVVVDRANEQPSSQRRRVVLTKDLSDEELEMIMNAKWGQVSG